MEGLTLAFVVLPCVGACLAAWLLRDWRLAGAVASGGGALLILAATNTLPFLGLLLPLLSGAVVGAITTGLMLAALPEGSLWTRMSTALAAAFVLFYAYMAMVSQRVL